ncbi:MAG TPA: hypothetical protein VGL69_18520 [Solirubrobacteraceae bacterium]|jgi:hypothetical protein
MTNGDYFDRLDSELSDLIRRAAHLEGSSARLRRCAWLARRATLAMIVGLALAVTLISEFPSSASGAGPRASVSAMGA